MFIILLVYLFIFYIFGENTYVMDEELNATINLNPRINIEDKRDFERNLFESKQDGFKVNKALLFRALVYKFNDNPGKALNYLGIKKSK